MRSAGPISAWLSNLAGRCASLEIAGRIACHAYNSYLGVPVSSSDGHILVYDLASPTRVAVTSSLPVQNAMNPRFSTDGARLTFMAIPQGKSPAYAALEVYLLDLADQSLRRLTDNTVPDEDPDFAPDGERLVFKRSGQIWVINADGTGARQLTQTSAEKSGPRFAPDGASIVYWSKAAAEADVAWMRTDGSQARVLVANPGLQDYYPVFRDARTVLYTRWESTADHHDKIYEYSIATGLSQRLLINRAGSEDADPFPIDANTVGFSTTRSGGKGGYDLCLGDTLTGQVQWLAPANSPLHELGGVYSPFRHARKLRWESPGTNTTGNPGTPLLLQVRALSDGIPWTAASPRVVWQGPATLPETLLRDNGQDGDALAGDGIFSALLNWPAVPGAYQISCSALSEDNSLIHLISGPSIQLTVPATPYGSWLASHFAAEEILVPSLSGDSADPDGDGLVNLAEYASGRDPRVRDPEAAPVWLLQDGYLVLRYNQAKAASDLEFRLESSPTLAGDWTTNGLVEVDRADQGATWRVLVRGPSPLAAHPQHFLRVRVSRAH